METPKHGDKNEQGRFYNSITKRWVLRLNDSNIYEIKYQVFDINKAKSVTPDFIKRGSTNFVIPFTYWNTLIGHINANPEDNHYSFIYGYLKIVSLLIENSGKRDTSAKFMRKVCRDYKRILDILNDHFGYVSNYVVGDHARTYQMIVEESEYVIVSMNHLFKVNEDTLTNQLAEDNPAQNQINALVNSTIDITSAINAEIQLCLANEKTNAAMVSRINTAIEFYSGERFIKKGENVDRVYSSFSQLSKVSRQYVMMNGRRFYEVDIKNCQPMLLLLLFEKENLAVDPQYREDVLSGQLYDKFKAYAKERNYDSEIVLAKETGERTHFYFEKDYKTLLYRSIFFLCKSTKQSTTARLFAELYPITYKTISEYQGSLAATLQSLEAELVLDIIPSGPYFTVHDAIYVLDRDDVRFVKQALNEKITELSGGKLITIKTEETAPHQIQVLREPVVQFAMMYVTKHKIKKESEKEELEKLNKRKDTTMEQQTVAQAENWAGTYTNGVIHLYKNRLRKKFLINGKIGFDVIGDNVYMRDDNTVAIGSRRTYSLLSMVVTDIDRQVFYLTEQDVISFSYYPGETYELQIITNGKDTAVFRNDSAEIKKFMGEHTIQTPMTKSVLDDEEFLMEQTIGVCTKPTGL